MEDDSWVGQNSSCTDFEDAVDDSLPNELNINPFMSENTKSDELNISQEPKKTGCPSKKKKSC